MPTTPPDLAKDTNLEEAVERSVNDLASEGPTLQPSPARAHERWDETREELPDDLRADEGREVAPWG